MYSFISKLLIFTAFICLILKAASANAQQRGPYPKVTGYFSAVNPIGSFNRDGFQSNFSDVYTIGFPFGLNLLKNDRFGVSFEIAPFIRTENNASRVSSVLFHPGAVFRFKQGFNFIGRMAFETNGRFGVTPVINKVIVNGSDASMFVSVPFPLRFGNQQPTSLGTAIQLGVSF